MGLIFKKKCVQQNFSISKINVALQVKICHIFNFGNTNLPTQSLGTKKQSRTVRANAWNIPLFIFVPVGDGPYFEDTSFGVGVAFKAL